MLNTARALSLTLLLPLLLLATACGDSLEQGNLEANITAVGPIALDAQNRIFITYALRDLEGDDQDITLEICEKDAQKCGTPNPKGKNSGSLKHLPTLPANTDVTHTFSFDTACGRIVDDKTVPFTLNTPYIVRVQINDTEKSLTSPEFTLTADLGLTAIPPCK